MKVFIVVFFSVIIISLVIQIFILYKATKRKSEKNENLNGKYSDEINQIGTKALYAVNNGTIKKQLLLNDAPVHNSEIALEHYKDFVHTTNVYKKIITIKERRYDG